MEINDAWRISAFIQIAFKEKETFWFIFFLRDYVTLMYTSRIEDEEK